MIQEYGNKNIIDSVKLNLIKSFCEEFPDVDFNIYYAYETNIKEDETNVFLPFIIISEYGIFISSDFNKEALNDVLSNKIFKADMISLKILGKNFLLCLDQIYSSDFKLENKIFTKKDLNNINSILQNAESLKSDDTRDIKTIGSLGELIKTRNKSIAEYDSVQFNAIYSKDISSHLRIRGLAGSGKTVVLVKKMAFQHYKFPDLDLAYVFFSVSLKQFITNLFIKFYHEFEPNKEPDLSKVHFFHCWGTPNYPGFYTTVCDAVSYKAEYYVEGYGRTIDSVSNNLLIKIGKQKVGLYDYIFLDEAQDFGLPFFQLILSSLKSEGKLIYAYDELQTLIYTNNMPTKKDIFEDEPCEDINLSICYRTPNEILVAAHALGMGIYNRDKEHKIFNIPEDLSIREAVGYNSDLDIAYGQKVDLFRQPSKGNRYICKNPVEFCKYDTVEEQYKDISIKIYDLIKKQDITISDILIIDLSSFSLEDDYYDLKEISTNILNIRKHGKERAYSLSLVSKDNRYNFKNNNSISFTNIFRAKGNESNIVFILNVQALLSLPSYSRNQLFTAMTRAKTKVYICGTEEIEKYENEFKEVQKNNYHLIFDYPSIEKLQDYRSIAKKENETANHIKKVKQFSDELKKTNPEAYREMLLAQFGNNAQEIIDFIGKNYEKENK